MERRPIDLLIWLWRLPRRRRLARRRQRGLCYYCGYDVHGTEGRCPECGRYPIFRRGGPPDWPDIVLNGADDEISG